MHTEKLTCTEYMQTDMCAHRHRHTDHMNTEPHTYTALVNIHVYHMHIGMHRTLINMHV